MHVQIPWNLDISVNKIHKTKKTKTNTRTMFPNLINSNLLGLVHIYALIAPVAKSTSVCAARLVCFRVSLHSESELMVPFPPGPLGLRPEDPPAVPVRPASGGLFHESGDVAHKTRDKIVLQKQQMQIHSHFGTAARR